MTDVHVGLAFLQAPARFCCSLLGTSDRFRRVRLPYAWGPRVKIDNEQEPVTALDKVLGAQSATRLR